MKKLFLKLSVFILCATALASANESPRLMGYPQEKIMGFRGLDTNSSAPLIEDGRATDLLNVKLSSGYKLKKRYGYSVINGKTLDDADNSSPAITGLFDSEFSNGNSWTLAFLGDRLKYDNSGTWTRVGGSGVITSDQNAQWLCQMALDNAICTNDTDPPLKIDSTPSRSTVSFSGLSSPITKAKAEIWFRNYLIFGNVVEGGTRYPTRFRWSNVGTIGTWTQIDVTDIASLNGDEIIAFKEIYGELYIFMRKSIWKASLVGGNDVFVFNKVIDGIGAVSKGSVSVISLPDNRLAVIFLDENKRLLMFDGAVVTDIGAKIQPTLNNLNASRLQYAWSVFDGFDYYLSVSSSGVSTNDVVYVFNAQIMEWYKYDEINANVFTRIRDNSDLTLKTLFGNYKAFVYWLDNPDNLNDVDGATGIVDSVGTLNSNIYTGAQVIIDAGLASGVYTGATIHITSGTGAGQEGVIISGLTTGVVVATAFSTTPDSTSNYSIGDINAYYKTKWYDFADAPKYKSFRSMFFWAKEQADSEVIISYAEDFGSTIGSETKSLAPSSSSLWDQALWDVGTWGTTGDKLYTVQQTGMAKNIQVEFAQSGVDKTFEIYGFHLLADSLDVQ